jgi:hypothetical protein
MKHCCNPEQENKWTWVFHDPFTQGTSCCARVQERIGRQECLVPVKAAASQRALLGSDTVLTPVRRSTRKSTVHGTPPPATLAHSLEVAHWAYSPNVALCAEDGSTGAEYEPTYEGTLVKNESAVAVEELLVRMHAVAINEEGGQGGERGRSVLSTL